MEHGIELDSLPVLRDLDPAERASLVSQLRVSHWKQGQEQRLSPGLWLLAAGQSRIVSEPASGVLDGGAIVGETSLGSAAITPLELQAITACTWLHLDLAAFHKLSREAPSIALRLIMSALARSSERPLVAASTLPLIPALSAAPHRNKTVSVLIAGASHNVALGTRCQALLPEMHEHLPVVAALVDNKATSLSTPITSSCSLTPLTTRHWEGQRIYRHSLALLALEAAHNIAPGLPVRIGPSVGFGRRILAGGLINSELHQFAKRLQDELSRLCHSSPTVSEEHWAVDEAREYFASHGWESASRLLETWRDASVPMVSYGAVYAFNITPVVIRSEILDNFFVLCDDNIVLLVFGKRSEHMPRPARTLPPRALNAVGEKTAPASTLGTSSLLLGQVRANHDVERDEQAWLRTLGVTSVGAFNHTCVTKSVPALIRVAEGFQEKRLAVIADEIQRRAHDLDIVCIAGPSASGKTTFIRRLCVQLQVNGLNPVALSLDDYYINRLRTPRDESGDYDFESLHAIDLGSLENHLGRLLSGELVQTSRYDFISGKSLAGPEIQLQPSDVLLLEGTHGLNPALLANLAPQRIFRIFVCPLMQLAFDQLSSVHVSDMRLIRRIVRDRHGRGYAATETILRWPKVRAGERQHIYPYQIHSDAVFDSSLVYEMSVLRVYAERYLLEVPRSHSTYQTAARLMHLLDRFVSIYPQQVPGNSILREFIGDSSFEV